MRFEDNDLNLVDDSTYQKKNPNRKRRKKPSIKNLTEKANQTMAAHTLKILQPNFLSLSNSYRTIDPDILLINSHGNPSDRKIKMFGFNTLQTNTVRLVSLI